MPTISETKKKSKSKKKNTTVLPLTERQHCVVKVMSRKDLTGKNKGAKVAEALLEAERRCRRKKKDSNTPVKKPAKPVKKPASKTPKKKVAKGRSSNKK